MNKLLGVRDAGVQKPVAGWAGEHDGRCYSILFRVDANEVAQWSEAPKDEEVSRMSNEIMLRTN